MQIVIDIREEDYEIMKHNVVVGNPLCPIGQEEMVNKVANGTPLPKGHGNLIDRNELKKVYDERITYLYTLNRKDNPSREAKICATNWCSNTVEEAPTIIEADKAESEV